MRCAYCHNPNIVLGGKGTLPMDDIFTFLEKRQGLLNGVVLSGGEATLYPHLEEAMQKIKQLDFAVKLDTNGTRPEIVQKLIRQNLVDYLALDYKAPKAKFKLVTGTNHYKKFNTTLDYLCSSQAIPFEVRITVHTDLMDEADVTCILDDLAQKNYRGTCYIQNYRHTETIKNLDEQKRSLNVASIKQDWPFQLKYRNF